MAGFCAVPTGSTEAGAWPAFIRRPDWSPRWELKAGAENLQAPWTALTPRVLHRLLPPEGLPQREEIVVGLEAALTQSCAALLAPTDSGTRIPELRLGNHRVPGTRIDIGGHERPAFAFCLDTLQQAALVVGSPRLGWVGEATEWPIEGALQDGLRIQLPEAIQFAATFVD